MKFKIIQFEGCPTCDEVLLQVCRIEGNENEVVEISAWHVIDDIEYYQIEALDFPNLLMAEQFVSDYSKESAVFFACDFQN